MFVLSSFKRQLRSNASLDVYYPYMSAPRVIDLDGSKPRTYWQKFWIQLALQIIGWLDPEQQAAARKRLRKLKVSWR